MALWNAGSAIALKASEQSSMLRTPEVQTLRGLACVLLVAFHVVGHDATAGLRVPDDSSLRFIVELFAHLRMPLFSFLSGYVYALRPLQRGDTAEFLGKKVWRLYVPLVAVSTLYFLLHTYVPGVNAEHRPLRDIWEIYFFSYTHFWFLQALLVIFLLLAILELYGALATRGRFFLVLAVALFMHWGNFLNTEFFSIGRATYLLPFFLLGLGFARFRTVLPMPSIGFVCIASFVALICYRVLTLHGFLGGPEGQRALVSTMEGMSGLIVLALFMPRMGWLARVGAYSFTIYLYHVFFTAGSRVILTRAGFPDVSTGFAAGMVCGLLGPVLLHELLMRTPPALQRVFLGTRSSSARRA